MRNSLLLATAGLVAVGLYSCKKDKDDNNPTDINTTASLQCQPLTEVDSTTNQMSVEYEYDAQKRVVRVKNPQTMSSNNGYEQITYGTNTITMTDYDSSGRANGTYRVVKMSNGKPQTTYSYARDSISSGVYVTTDTIQFTYSGSNLSKITWYGTRRSAAGVLLDKIRSEQLHTFNGSNLIESVYRSYDDSGHVTEDNREAYTYGNTPDVKYNPLLKFDFVPGMILVQASKIPTKMVANYTYRGTTLTFTSYYNAQVDSKGFPTKITLKSASMFPNFLSTNYTYRCN